MKFTNYKNFMAAITGLIVMGDWGLYRMEMDIHGVTTVTLFHDQLELTYIFEHHKDQASYEQSTLTAFTRSRRTSPLRYEREPGFQETVLGLLQSQTS